VDHSCTQTSGEYADPGVRLKLFVDSFGSNGLFLPICAPTLVPALETIGKTLFQVFGPHCVVGQLLDKAGNPTDGPGADCSVVDHHFTDTDMEVDAVVPPCPSPPDPNQKCWTLDVDPTMCKPTNGVPSHVLNFHPAPDTTMSGLNASISCSLQVN
jgi:hypothetical protein